MQETGQWIFAKTIFGIKFRVSAASARARCLCSTIRLHTSSAFSRRCSFAARRRQSHTSARSQLLKHHYARQMHVGIGCVASFSENVQSF